MLIPLGSNSLLFILVACLASSVDLRSVRQREGRLLRAVGVAMLCQFVLLPFIGFCAVKAFTLDKVSGVMLQVVVSSPGGAYSNWWCSLFNADLMLSVAATAVSTILSAGLLPLNLYVYLNASYGGDALMQRLRWDLLFISIGVVTAAVCAGLLASHKLSQLQAKGLQASVRKWRHGLSSLGNVAGLGLITFYFVFSSDEEPIWDKTPAFYAAVAMPAVVALVLSMALTSLPCLHLARPERVAVTIECLYQNTGIAMSIAFSIFSGSEASIAAGTPLYYGFCQTVLIPICARALTSRTLPPCDARCDALHAPCLLTKTASGARVRQTCSPAGNSIGRMRLRPTQSGVCCESLTRTAPPTRVEWAWRLMHLQLKSNGRSPHAPPRPWSRATPQTNRFISHPRGRRYKVVGLLRPRVLFGDLVPPIRA